MSGLRRTLGLGSLTFYGVGLILGAGVYSVIGAAAAQAGAALWQSFALGSLAALLTGLSYAELATAYPKAGAEFVYLGAAFPGKMRWLAALVGMVLVVGAATTATTVAVAFGGYLADFVKVPGWLAAVSLLAAATGLCVFGLRESTWVNIVFTLIEAGGLVLFITVGTAAPRFGEALATPPHFGVMSGTALVFFAYLGFEEIANLAEETREPGRDLPRAILLSVAITTTLYVLVGLAAVALVAPEDLAKSESPLAHAARASSPLAARALGAIALFATANTALITLLAASRMLYGMARENALPQALAKVSARGTPWAATLAVAALALAALPLGGVAALAGLSSFAALLGFAAVNVALIVLRRREPARKRPFRVPMSLGGIPVLPVLGIAITLLLATRFDPSVYVAGAGAIALSAAAVFARRLVK